MKKHDIKLIALDLDGTLFNSHTTISNENKDAIKMAVSKGCHVVISTGRPLIGLPLEELKDIGVDYAITSNGAAIYHIPTKECIYKNCMSYTFASNMVHTLLQHKLHMDAFIQGKGYTQRSTQEYIPMLALPEKVRCYVKSTRTVVDDLPQHILDHKLDTEKMTLNFIPCDDHSFADREEIKQMLIKEYPEIDVVSGGFNNLEFTKKGVSKGAGLLFLCDYFHLDQSQTMAIGDSENDLNIIATAAVGVAMKNAEEIVLNSCDFVTKTNDEHGVAFAIETFLA